MTVRILVYILLECRCVCVRCSHQTSYDERSPHALHPPLHLLSLSFSLSLSLFHAPEQTLPRWYARVLEWHPKAMDYTAFVWLKSCRLGLSQVRNEHSLFYPDTVTVMLIHPRHYFVQLLSQLSLSRTLLTLLKGRWKQECLRKSTSLSSRTSTRLTGRSSHSTSRWTSSQQ